MTVGKIIFTLGDPLSINYAGFRQIMPPLAARFCIIAVGSRWQLEHQLSSHDALVQNITSVSSIDQPTSAGLYLFDPLPDRGLKAATHLTPAERGELACAALKAVPASSPSPFAVLTAPIDKYASSLAGFHYPGQTEFFESLWQAKAVMLLAGPKLRVALSTNHLALANVAQALDQTMVENKLILLSEGLRSVFGISVPRIAVCGLNPHCSDHGLFGTEEQTVIKPAILKAASRLKVGTISGPFPADTVFYRAMHGEFDVVLAQYHDQGLGPLKTVHFDEAVNVSLGLPYFRVSPDHGPAADLYGKGGASFRSFQAAADLCARYLDHQRNSP